MKTFKDLSPAQKKSAVDIMFKRLINNKVYQDKNTKVPQSISHRMHELETSLNFCGCLSCRSSLHNLIIQDSQVKEWILSLVIASVEKAYYPDESDILIKVN